MGVLSAWSNDLFSFYCLHNVVLWLSCFMGKETYELNFRQFSAYKYEYNQCINQTDSLCLVDHRTKSLCEVLNHLKFTIHYHCSGRMAVKL